MLNSIRKWKRLQRFLAILSKHGFQELVSAFSKESDILQSVEKANTAEHNLYVRIRLALEELGPTFVKLGQAFANREDILPKELTCELQQLQDNVAAVAIDIPVLLQNELGLDVNDHFTSIATMPIAAASIAQVYEARLISGERVALKIKRPGIQPVIEEDLMVIKMFAKFLKRHFAFAQKMHLYEGVLSFETALLQELSFVQEVNNMQLFQRCYKGQDKVRIPLTFATYCSNEVICMEYIDGAKITNIEFMHTHGMDVKAMAVTGMHTYLDQILNFGVFHADPHAGNVLVMPNGQIAFIDFGAVGNIANKDRLLLEDFILFLLTKNTRMLIATLKKMALDIKIGNEKIFEQDIQSILDMVQQGSLDAVDPKIMLDKFKNLVHTNEILLPPYIYLLVRGVMLIESIGRSIYPAINLMHALQPYVFKIIKKRMHWQYWAPQILNTAQAMGDILQHMPQQVQQTLQNLENGELKFSLLPSAKETHSRKQQLQTIVWLSILGMVGVCATLLYKDVLLKSVFGQSILPVVFGMLIVLAVFKIFIQKK